MTGQHCPEILKEVNQKPEEPKYLVRVMFRKLSALTTIQLKSSIVRCLKVKACFPSMDCFTHCPLSFLLCAFTVLSSWISWLWLFLRNNVSRSTRCDQLGFRDASWVGRHGHGGVSAPQKSADTTSPGFLPHCRQLIRPSSVYSCLTAG